VISRRKQKELWELTVVFHFFHLKSHMEYCEKLATNCLRYDTASLMSLQESFNVLLLLLKLFCYYCHCYNPLICSVSYFFSSFRVLGLMSTSTLMSPNGMQRHRKLYLDMTRFFARDVRPLRNMLINVKSKQQVSCHGLSTTNSERAMWNFNENSTYST
jgi:hypothetical protein